MKGMDVWLSEGGWKGCHLEERRKMYNEAILLNCTADEWNQPIIHSFYPCYLLVVYSLTGAGMPNISRASSQASLVMPSGV